MGRKHNFRFGGDIRRVHSDSLAAGNVLGGFSFTGYAQRRAPAAGECTSCAASGNSFADFLLGLPQTTSIQASQFKTYLRENVYDWYVRRTYLQAASKLDALAGAAL